MYLCSILYVILKNLLLNVYICLLFAETCFEVIRNIFCQELWWYPNSPIITLFIEKVCI